MNKCMFFHCDRCSILRVKACYKNCKFKKTEREFSDAIRASEEILRKKGLRSVIRSNGKGVEIMTTEAIE